MPIASQILALALVAGVAELLAAEGLDAVRRRRGRPVAVRIALAVCLAIPSFLAVGALVGVPPAAVMLVPYGASIILAAGAPLLVRVTGGPAGPATVDARSLAPPGSPPSGSGGSIVEAVERIHAAQAQAQAVPVQPLGVRGKGLLVIAAVAIAAGPPLLAGSLGWKPAMMSVCAQAQATADAAVPGPGREDVPLERLLPRNFAVTGSLVGDVPLDLDGAARTRSDPTARTQLEAAGFETGYQRTWRTEHGRTLVIEALRFGTREGASMFHRGMTLYACRFANAAFTGPAAAVGLQTRISRGDPIVEQLAWVDGATRFLVSYSFLAPPPDHSDVLALADVLHLHRETVSAGAGWSAW